MRPPHFFYAGVSIAAVLVLSPAVVTGLALTAQKPAGAASSTKLATAEERWKDLAKADEPSFRRHVVPLMSRTGCSGRECHGAFSGQGGFQLSLFGYDFDKDHQAITAEGDNGPRIELKDPADSLILLKPTMQEKHKGKERIKKGSWEYNLLLKWIQNGAKNDTEATGEFDKLVVEPREIVFKNPGESAQLRVMAYWKDGAVEDITQLTRFRTNDESVATVSDTGRVEIKSPGDTHIVAFYDNGVLPVPVMLPVSAAPYPTVKTRTKLDELVVAKLRKAGIVPSEVCTDAEFLRRVSLDVAGTLPTPEEIAKFLADKAPNKRAAKIEELLATPAYAAWWSTKFCDFTGNNPRQLNNGGQANFAQEYSREWYDWIFKRIAGNEPYDKFAAGIVLATGRSKPEQTYTDYALEMASYLRKENPVDFAQRETMPHFWARQNVRKPEEKALAFAHTFLGVRIECAQCHKHPFDQWTKTDFAQFQAFFEPVEFGTRNDRSEEVNYSSVQKEIEGLFGGKRDGKTQKMIQDEIRRRVNAGEVTPMRELYIRAPKQQQTNKGKDKNQNFAGRVITPKLLGGDEVHLTEYPDPRLPLMQWMRNKDNPYFSRAFVNRVWASYFNRGLVEPADDMNLANPPVNREVMDYLADGFVAHGFDMKWVHREILNSDTYQRSWKTNATNKLDEKNFSHAVIRRLPAEVVYDAVAMATASSERSRKFATSIDERAIGPNGNSAYRGGGGGKGGDGYALAIFGKPAREANCDCERTTDPTLLQTIYTRNDPTFLNRIEGNSAWIDELRQNAARTQQGGGFEKSLNNLRDELAKMKAPEKPADGDASALAQWERANTQYGERIARMKARIADMERPRPPFDLDNSIREVFLRTVGRPPTVSELEKAKADTTAAKSPVDGVRDLLWAMLNTREFVVNH